MCKAIPVLCRHQSRFHRYTFRSRTRFLSAVAQISSPLDHVNIDDFRNLAFIPQQPLLITTNKGSITTRAAVTASHFPAVKKWFIIHSNGGHMLNLNYLEQFQDIVLPYELVSFDSYITNFDSLPNTTSNETKFQRFHAPLKIFLAAARSSQPTRLYIAQAQLQDLPLQLRDDLPTPPLVLQAGKGDIYDSNIWMGIPPTYTPLHKDPNPNLFVQLASSKVVRLFRPDTGKAIFHRVQETIGQQASATFRGDEMMQGPERKALEEAVWKFPIKTDGYEVVVRPGDALFIPKGWWHSIKSIGDHITASVNWWFR